jgi:hypothetical protein
MGGMTGRGEGLTRSPGNRTKEGGRVERIGLFIGAMLALVVLGVVLSPAGEEEAVTEPVVVEEAPTTVIQDLTLEMLDPVYSEKAVFDDGIIRASFDITQTADGVESGLSLWLHNSADEALVLHWDRCSFQLPSADTVNLVHEDQAMELGAWVPSTLTIAPGGDLFTTLYPAGDTQLGDGEWIPSVGLLSTGPFGVVLTLEAASCMHSYAFRFIVR